MDPASAATADSIRTVWVGRSDLSVGTLPSRSTTSMPEDTRPKIVCFPASRAQQGWPGWLGGRGRKRASEQVATRAERRTFLCGAVKADSGVACAWRADANVSSRRLTVEPSRGRQCDEEL